MKFRNTYDGKEPWMARGSSQVRAGGRMSTERVNGTCTIKRRRTRANMAYLRQELRLITEQYDRATCRQIFYQAVQRGLIEKTEASTGGRFAGCYLPCGAMERLPIGV